MASLGIAGLVFPSATSGQAQDFGSVSEAERYLEQNPTGPRAAAAFRFLVYQGLGDRYPNFQGTPTTRNIAPLPQQNQPRQQQPRRQQQAQSNSDDDDRDRDDPPTTY